MHGRPDQSSSSPNRPPRPPRDPLDRLRGYRVRPDRARTLEDDLKRTIGSIKKVSKAESAAIDAWNTAAPDELTAHCRVSGLRAGKLVVLVPGAPQRYIAQRWLSSGGLAELQTLARVPIRGVDLRVDPGLGSKES
ncbi:MAG: DciA family protein [Phycisphaerales bacterium]